MKWACVIQEVSEGAMYLVVQLGPERISWCGGVIS